MISVVETRPWLLGFSFVVVAGVLLYGFAQLEMSTVVSGWILFTLCLFLLAFGIRKKVTTLPLGSAYLWSQLHIVVGALAIGIFYVHSDGFKFTGLLETILGWVLAVAMVVGIVGVLLNKLLPPLMNRRGGRIYFSKIKADTANVRREADRAILQLIDDGGGEDFIRLYESTISPYFFGTQDILKHLFSPDAPRRYWQSKFAETRRYADNTYSDLIDELEALVQAKVDLDYQYVSQWLLKGWLMAHILVSVIIALLIPIHVLLVYAFG